MTAETTADTLLTPFGEWSDARAAGVIEQFAEWADGLVLARIAKDRIDKQEALAKAEAVSPTSAASRGFATNNLSGWGAHAMQPWTAEEERYATTTLASLRAQHSRMRKTRSRFASEPPSSWSVLNSKTTKLSPQGAAEMARARVAAAAAAAAMRLPDANTHKSNEAAAVESEERTSKDFDTTPYTNAIFRRAEGAMSRRTSITARTLASARIPGQSARKRVEFSPDTVFDLPKRK